MIYGQTGKRLLLQVLIASCHSQVPPKHHKDLLSRLPTLLLDRDFFLESLTFSVLKKQDWTPQTSISYMATGRVRELRTI